MVYLHQGQKKVTILDINQTISALDIKLSDVVEVLENEFLSIKISINKKNPKLVNIKTAMEYIVAQRFCIFLIATILSSIGFSKS